MTCYLLLDGDSTGDALELALLQNDDTAAREYVNRIQGALREMCEVAVRRYKADLIFVGGDEIFMKFQDRDQAPALAADLQQLFHDRTGNSISIGIGETPRQAVVSLRVAKLRGKNQTAEIDWYHQ